MAATLYLQAAESRLKSSRLHHRPGHSVLLLCLTALYLLAFSLPGRADTLTSLVSFQTPQNGTNPYAGLIQAKDGSFYGTTTYGGVYLAGTVFKITTGGVLTRLHSFNGFDGFSPNGLIQATDGNFYGTTYGAWNYPSTVFKITPSGAFTSLYTFSFPVADGANSDGSSPTGLIQATDGNLYGTTAAGGEFGEGTVFAFALANITSLSPNPVQAATTFTLTINGAGFLNGAIVYWNTYPLKTTFVSANQLTAVVPDGIDALLPTYPGTAHISVVNPDTSRATASLTITAPIPRVTTLKPSSQRAGSSGFTLAVNGRSFTADAVVYFGNNPLTTTFGSKTDLSATVPANLLYTPDSYPVTVVQAGGTSNAVDFTVTAGPVLTLTVGTLSRDSNNNIVVPLTLINTSTGSVSSAAITGSTLKGVKTTTNLPISLGNLGIAASGSATLVFAGSVGSSGVSAPLTVTVGYTGGSHTFKSTVTLP